MSAGYWVVVGCVTCAALAVLVAAILERPEWQVPRRRLPLILLYDLASGQPRHFLPADVRWSTVVAEIHARTTSDSSQARRFELATYETLDDLDAVVQRRPNGVIILGLPDLVLSGTPFDQVTDSVQTVVQRLAKRGCRSFVLGFVTPPTTTIARSRINLRALDRQIRVWNVALARKLARYDARVVTSPEQLVRALDAVSHKPLSVASDASPDSRSLGRETAPAFTSREMTLWSNAPRTF